MVRLVASAGECECFFPAGPAADRVEYRSTDRQLQLVQWTFASTPNHPIPLSATLRILHSTSKAIRWSHSRASKLERLKAELAAGDGSMEDREALEESIKKLEGTAVTATLKDGGPVGIMDWTGPGVWTDAVLRYVTRSCFVDTCDSGILEQTVRGGAGP